MKDAGFRAIARLTRVWTRLYTAGIAPDLRDRRRAEIESDLWESTRQLGRVSAGHILVRVLMGIPDDVSWRCSHEGAAFGVRVILVIMAILATSVVVAALVFLFSLGRATRLPTPEPVFHHVHAMPAPPPPPPPPCAPPGLGRTSPSPCTP